MTRVLHTQAKPKAALTKAKRTEAAHQNNPSSPPTPCGVAAFGIELSLRTMWMEYSGLRKG